MKNNKHKYEVSQTKDEQKILTQEYIPIGIDLQSGFVESETGFMSEVSVEKEVENINKIFSASLFHILTLHYHETFENDLDHIYTGVELPSNLEEKDIIKRDLSKQISFTSTFLYDTYSGKQYFLSNIYGDSKYFVLYKTYKDFQKKNGKEPTKEEFLGFIKKVVKEQKIENSIKESLINIYTRLINHKIRFYSPALINNLIYRSLGNKIKSTIVTEESYVNNYMDHPLIKIAFARPFLDEENRKFVDFLLKQGVIEGISNGELSDKINNIFPFQLYLGWIYDDINQSPLLNYTRKKVEMNNLDKVISRDKEIILQYHSTNKKRRELLNTLERLKETGLSNRFSNLLDENELKASQIELIEQEVIELKKTKEKILKEAKEIWESIEKNDDGQTPKKHYFLRQNMKGHLQPNRNTRSKINLIRGFKS